MARGATAVLGKVAVSDRRTAPKAGRSNDPDATQADILSVALREFADKGLSGARIDEIAEQTRTSKRMIYYYFGSKEGLYMAVLEDCYRGMRNLEDQLNLDHVAPLDALGRLVAATFDYQSAHPDFVRLVMVENIHHGEYIDAIEALGSLNARVIDRLRRICDRGVAEGVMRRDIDPVDLHMTISALSFFNVSNRYTFSHIFGCDMTSTAALMARRDSVVNLVIRSVTA